MFLTTILMICFLFPSVTANTYPTGTVSVLHFNSSGHVNDEMGHTGTAENLWYSNVIKKFGAGSELFNGYAWIYTDNDPTFSPGSENFTFSVWVYPTSTLSGRGLVWGNWWPNQGGTCLDFLSGVPRFVYDNSGTTKIISGTTAPPVNPWTNIVLQGKTLANHRT